MVWVKTSPAAGIVDKNLDDLIVTNNTALEATIDKDHNLATGGSQTGDHKQVTLNDLAGDAAGEASHLTVYNDAGVLKQRNGTGTVRKISSDGDVIPAGTKMWFFANTAPTGWTADATVTDGLLALKGAAGGTPYETGGISGPGGTWTQPGHTHTTGDKKLTSAESGVPAHTHTFTGDFQVIVPGGATHGVLANTSLQTTNANAAANAASAHNHGATAAGATADTWRPTAAVGLIATKDAY